MNLAVLDLVIRSREARKAKRDLDALEASAKKTERTAKTLENATGRVDTRMSSFQRTVRDTELFLRRLVIGFAAFRIVGGAVRTLSEFEETMLTLRGIAISTTDSLADQEQQFRDLNDAARLLGETTRFSAAQAAEANIALGRAGFDVNEIIRATPSVLALAQSALISLGEAAAITATVIRQFGLDAAEAARVTDVLTKVANSSNTTVTQLGEAFKFVGPVAGALGLTLEETAAALGTLGDRGIQASLAGTSLRGTLAALSAATPNAERVISGLGLALEEVDLRGESLIDVFRRFNDVNLSASAALGIFARRNAASALILASNIDTFEELTEAARNSRGEALRLATLQDTSLIGSYKRLVSVLQETVLATGDKGLIGALKGVLDTSADVIRILFDLGDGAAQANDAARALVDSLKILGSVLALAGIAKAVIALKAFAAQGAIVSGVLGAISAFAVANPFIAIAAAIAGLSTALFILRPRITSVKERLEELGITSSSTSDALENLRAAFTVALDEDNVEGQIDSIRGAISTLRDELVFTQLQVDNGSLQASFGDVARTLNLGIDELAERVRPSLDAFTSSYAEQLAGVLDPQVSGAAPGIEDISAIQRRISGALIATQSQRSAFFDSLGLDDAGRGALTRRLAASLQEAYTEALSNGEQIIPEDAVRALNQALVDALAAEDIVSVPNSLKTDLIREEIRGLEELLPSLERTANERKREAGLTSDQAEALVAEAAARQEAAEQLAEQNRQLDESILASRIRLEVGGEEAEQIIDFNKALVFRRQVLGQNAEEARKGAEADAARRAAIRDLNQQLQGETEETLSVVEALRLENEILAANGIQRDLLILARSADSDEIARNRQEIVQLLEINRRLLAQEQGINNFASAVTDVFSSIRKGVESLNDVFQRVFDNILNNLLSRFLAELLKKLGEDSFLKQLLGLLFSSGGDFFGGSGGDSGASSGFPTSPDGDLLAGPPAPGTSPGSDGFGDGGGVGNSRFGPNGLSDSSLSFSDGGAGGLGLFGAFGPTRPNSGGGDGSVGAATTQPGTINLTMVVSGVTDAGSFRRSMPQIERDLRSTARRAFI